MRPTEAQQRVANQMVFVMYGSFPTPDLQRLLDYGEIQERQEPTREAIAMNTALRAEIDRRKAEAQTE